MECKPVIPCEVCAISMSSRDRAMGMACATIGQRVSEVLGLKWEDFQTGQGNAPISRGWRCRPLQDGSLAEPVPLDELTLSEFQSWRKVTMYADTDWVFASERVLGKMPIDEARRAVSHDGDLHASRMEPSYNRERSRGRLATTLGKCLLLFRIQSSPKNVRRPTNQYVR